MNIIKGYKGIMDLDITNVDEKYHKVLIEEHLRDIRKYKKEQALLKPEMRYENTVGQALQWLQYENEVREKRRNRKL